MAVKEFLEIPARNDAGELRSLERGPLVIDALRELGISVDQKRVVDLGAGFGSVSVACLQSGALEVMAVDINQDRLTAIDDRARGQNLEVETRRVNLLEPWNENGNADLVLLFGVVEYAGLWSESLTVSELQQRVFQTAFDTLRPGGSMVFGSKNRLWPRFIVSDAHTGQPLVNVLPRRLADLLSGWRFGRPYRHHIHSPKKWAALIASAGFDDIETYVPYLSYQFPLKIVKRASFGDIPRVRRMPAEGEERTVTWGRIGTLKALLMAAFGTLGLQVSHSTIIVAKKPDRR